MPNIAAFTAISSGDALVASIVSTNFDVIRSVLDSNGLDSTNYGSGSIKSEHLSDDSVVADKIKGSNIRHTHLDFAQSNTGPRVVQFGNTANGGPVNGVVIARVSKTIDINNVSSVASAISFSEAVDGDPGFTATPVLMGVPALVVSASTDYGPDTYKIYSHNSDSMSVGWYFSGSQTIVATVHVGVLGAASAL